MECIVEPEAGLWVSCVSRAVVLGDRAAQEFRLAADLLDLPPLIGFYSYGEIAPKGIEQQGHYHATTQFLLLFKERKPEPAFLTDSQYLRQLSRQRMQMVIGQQEECIQGLRDELEQVRQALDKERASRGDGFSHRTMLREELIRALFWLLSENRGRLPPAALKGTGRINRIGLAKLLLKAHKTIHGFELGINEEAVSRHLADLMRGE